ncbi:hypothetical protein T484DRAFT_3034837, partial [Baffinella frigidus]
MQAALGLLALFASSTWLPLASAADVTITGHIYCDNVFSFWFNNALIKTDPITFTPHNAVKVSFTWDGTSDKHFAIMCQDFATASGYEYTETSSPQLGDGALLASFDDGTVTSKDWKAFVLSAGPTEASITAGCSGTNLAACALETAAEPTGWKEAGFTGANFLAATEYTAAEAGWGRTPSWRAGEGCCTATSPLTREDLTLNGGCSVNYDAGAPAAGFSA